MIGHLPRLLALWHIAAKHRLDVFLRNLMTSNAEFDLSKLRPLILLIRLHPASWFRRAKDDSLKNALEDMGTLFLKLGQLLSTRSDLLPPDVINQLALLQDKVTPFATDTAKGIVTDALGQPIDTLFKRFDDKPLAAASIAQVHTAALPDGREVIVKVVRPDIREHIINDFELLRDLGNWLESRVEAARALHLSTIVEDYRQVMLNELDLTLEASNTRQMRHNFMGSAMMYVPEVYADTQQVMVAERIAGVPISDLATFDRLGMNRAQLAEKGLTIFFTQVFRDNFFHADMHPGNVFVETLNPANPRFIALDCAIVGELSDQDRLVVARLLLSVMQNNFSQLVQVVHQAGWIPPNTDQHALARDMKRTVGPMVSKPIDQIDFAKILVEVLDIARRHRLDIPPQLMLLIKTLVHVEGLGRDLYPQLDIWKLAKPILTEWVGQQMNPAKTLRSLGQQLPDLLVGATDLPTLITDSLHSMRQQTHWQDQQLREMQQLRHQVSRERRQDWFTLATFFGALFLSTQLVWWGTVICYVVAFGLVGLRILR